MVVVVQSVITSPIFTSVSSAKISLRLPRTTNDGQSTDSTHSHNFSVVQLGSAPVRVRFLVSGSHFQDHFPSGISRMLYLRAPRTCSSVRPVYSLIRSANSWKLSRLLGNSRKLRMRSWPRRWVSGPVSTIINDRSVLGCRDAHIKLFRPPMEWPIRLKSVRPRAAITPSMSACIASRE